MLLNYSKDNFLNNRSRRLHEMVFAYTVWAAEQVQLSLFSLTTLSLSSTISGAINTLALSSRRHWSRSSSSCLQLWRRAGGAATLPNLHLLPNLAWAITPACFELLGHLYRVYATCSCIYMFPTLASFLKNGKLDIVECIWWYICYTAR